MPSHARGGNAPNGANGKKKTQGRRQQTKQYATNSAAVVGGSIAARFPTMPTRKRTHLSYFESAVTVISGVSVAGTQVFSANGLFDPNITGGGHQPMGYDQMMLFYEHYIVHSCKCTVVSVTSAVGPIFVSLSRNAGATPTTVITDLVENGNIEYQALPVGAVQTIFDKMVMVLDVAKFGGVDDILDNPEYRGAIGTNPAEQSYFHLSVWNPYSAATLSATFSVLLEFDASFVEPKKLAGS
jgi:hypothetical protein